MSSRKATIWITGDQCSMNNTALAAAEKQDAVVLMIESIERGNQIKYHKKKLVLIYSIMRHFAEELKAEGWRVDYHRESPTFASALQKHLAEYSPSSVHMMEQSEYGATERMTRMLEGLECKVYPHCNFISTATDFERLHKTPAARVTMESFYRKMRQKTGLLMEGTTPFGGQWNYDKDNRQAPDESLQTRPMRTFPPDDITNSVISMVEKHFTDHPGVTKDWIYAVTRKDALSAAEDFFEHRLDSFGPHQDAMLAGKPFLNHSVLSPYINTCLLSPLELCREAEQRYLGKKAQLSSVEGFIRQLIGWREFIWRVYWRLMPEYKQRNSLDATENLPDFFWTANTKMRCMNDAISTTVEHGYAHHIIRLMLLGNFSLIAGINPLLTNDWFHAMFVDGYDWVMVPNVIGMSLHADGGYVGTKPYAASANYINKMSNYCKQCKYNPKTATDEDSCPFNALYWDFLLRNYPKFIKNHRMSMIMRGLDSKTDSWKLKIRQRVESMRNSGWNI